MTHQGPTTGPRQTSPDSIGELLRSVGPPAEISAERISRHKEMARIRWQYKVARRSRQRRIVWGLAAVVLIAVGFRLVFSSFGPPTKPLSPVDLTSSNPAMPGAPARLSSPVARIESVAGPVQTHVSETKAGSRPLTANETLDRGGDITTGPVGRASLRLAGGHELRLDVNTHLRLISDTAVVLDQGAVYVDSFLAPDETSIEIRTPFGVASDIGTRFEVRLQKDSLRVRVRHGIVNLARADRVHEARSGAELTLDATGAVVRRSVPVHGLEWQWSQEISPAFEMEGRSLSELLSWACRETGWRLRIEDPVIAQGLDQVMLSGSIEDLSVTEALDAVLPTSGLLHHIADGELIVEPIRHDRAPTAVGPVVGSDPLP